jgi:hypothetical protein
VKSVSVHGGSPTVVTQFRFNAPSGAFQMAVVGDTVFLGGGPVPTQDFNLAEGVPDGGMPSTVQRSEACEALLAGEDAAYCLPTEPVAPITSIASDGTVTNLATAYSPYSGALDATSVYWCDRPDTGSLVKSVPRAGGASVTLASEDCATVAADDAAVYWATGYGSIRRLLR